MTKSKQATESESQDAPKKTIKRGGSKTPLFAGAIAQLRKSHPEVGLSTSSVFLLSSLGETLLDRFIKNAGRLAKYDKKDTFKAKHAATAVKLTLGGPLARHAYDYGANAVVRLNAAA